MNQPNQMAWTEGPDEPDEPDEPTEPDVMD